MRIEVVDMTCGGDGMYAMYINDTLFTAGDWYHDKIEDYIRGFTDCARDFYDSHVRNWELRDTSDDSYLKYNERREFPQNFLEFESELQECE